MITRDEFKKYANKKLVLGVLAIVGGIAVIFITSIIPLAFDPTQWGTKQFITNEIINVALTICGETSMIMTAQASNQQDPRSKIAKAIVEFNESMANNIGTNISAFCQWVRKVLQPNDLKDKYFRLLRSVGVEDMIYLDISESDLKECLRNVIQVELEDGKKRFVRQIDKKQYEMIKSIRDGEQTINFVAPETYLKISKIDNEKNGSEKMANQQLKTSLYTSSSILQKSLMVLCWGMIFASLINTFQEQSVAEILTNLAVRLSTYASACFVGFYIGSETNDMTADYIKERVLVHLRFVNDKDFKPLTDEELAKQDFVNRVKKENMEALTYDRGKEE